MTIAQAFNEIAAAQGGTPNNSGTIAGAIDALNDALAGSDQDAAATIEDAVRLLGNHIGGGSTPTGTIEITENGEGIDVAQYAYADVNVSGGSSDFTTAKVTLIDGYAEEGDFTIIVPAIVNVNGTYYLMGECSLLNGGTKTVDVVLYQGTAIAEVFFGNIGEDALQDATVEASGNATVDYSTVYITGDCTITCTGINSGD